MSDLFAVLIHALAVGAVVDVVRNGSILADVRSSLEAAPGGFLKDLIGCAFCLTYQAAFWLVVLCFTAGGWSFQLVAIPLAAARVSWLLDGLLPERLRYSREPRL